MYKLEGFQKNNFRKKLYETSIDTAGETYLLEGKYDIEVFNFDGIKRFICKKLRGGCELSSCDAYYWDEKENKGYLIEFKNNNYQNIDKEQIRNKAFDSCAILLYSNMIDKNAIDVRDTHDLIIVYNDGKKEDHDKEYGMSHGDAIWGIYEKLNKLAKQEEPVHTCADLGLDKIDKVLYKSIHVLNVDEFIGKYLNIKDGKCQFVVQ